MLCEDPYPQVYGTMHPQQLVPAVGHMVDTDLMGVRDLARDAASSTQAVRRPAIRQEMQVSGGSGRRKGQRRSQQSTWAAR